jgi:hypothetical protein
MRTLCERHADHIRNAKTAVVMCHGKWQHPCHCRFLHCLSRPYQKTTIKHKQRTSNIAEKQENLRDPVTTNVVVTTVKTPIKQKEQIKHSRMAEKSPRKEDSNEKFDSVGCCVCRPSSPPLPPYPPNQSASSKRCCRCKKSHTTAHAPFFLLGLYMKEMRSRLE